MSGIKASKCWGCLVVLAAKAGRMLKSGVVVGKAFAYLAVGNRCVLVSECFYQHLKDGKTASPFVHRSMGSRDGVVAVALAGWSGLDLGLVAANGLSWLLVL